MVPHIVFPENEEDFPSRQFFPTKVPCWFLIGLLHFYLFQLPLILLLQILHFFNLPIHTNLPCMYHPYQTCFFPSMKPVQQECFPISQGKFLQTCFISNLSSRLTYIHIHYSFLCLPYGIYVNELVSDWRRWKPHCSLKTLPSFGCCLFFIQMRWIMLFRCSLNSTLLANESIPHNPDFPSWSPEQPKMQTSYINMHIRSTRVSEAAKHVVADYSFSSFQSGFPEKKDVHQGKKNNSFGINC